MNDRLPEPQSDAPEKGSLWHDAKAGADAARTSQPSSDAAAGDGKDAARRGALFGGSEKKPTPATPPPSPAVTPAPVQPAASHAPSQTPEETSSKPAQTSKPSGPQRTGKPIVRLVEVSKAFGPLKVLDGVSIDIHPGQTTVIMGPSGTGKSVLLKHISGLLKPDRGEVWFEGQRIDAMTEKQLVPIRKQMGMLFQMGALFDSMAVGENVMFPLTEHNPRMALGEKRERARNMLKIVGLTGVDQKMPSDLSGGQKKRVALARAIILGPKLVLYDEPTTGLDPIRSDVINELIIRLTRQMGIASIVVTHDMASADKIADRMVMLYDGRIIIDDTPQAFHASDNDLVRRFVKGQADQEELDAIAQGIEPVAGM